MLEIKYIEGTLYNSYLFDLTIWNDTVLKKGIVSIDDDGNLKMLDTGHRYICMSHEKRIYYSKNSKNKVIEVQEMCENHDVFCF
tara:strand:+ start:40 stop:291 length:252 start_codon:yes stop_codon:yes gene_type:complete